MDVNDKAIAAAIAGPGEQHKAFGTDFAEATQWTIAGLAMAMLLIYQVSGPHQDTITEIVRVFLSIVLEALPFMLLGSLVGGVIEVFISGEKLSAVLSGKRKTTVLIAAAMGLIFPVCECAVVPVVRRLLRKGIPVSAAVAYLLAGPIVNPIVAASTLVAYRYDWRMLAVRLGLGYAIAVTVGLLIGRLFKDQRTLLAVGNFPDGHSHADSSCGCDHDRGHHHGDEPSLCPACNASIRHGLKICDQCGAPLPGHKVASLPSRLAEALRHAADDFLDIGRFLVIGALIAGVLRGAISQSFFVSFAGSPAVAIPAMMAFAFTLTLCSEADAFVAASFRGLVPPSAQIAFLVLGPMLDIKLLLMYTKLLRKRALAVLVGAILLAVLIAALLCKFLIRGW